MEPGKKLLCGDYTQYTPSGQGLFARCGQYGKSPAMGAVVYFWGRPDGKKGRVCHVGIVTDVSKQGDRYMITTVEGNTSVGESFNRNGGQVAKKHYAFTLDQVGGENRINGFGYPLFDSNTCTVDDFIKTALGEVGYIEKDSPQDLDGKTLNAGRNNYTKYGAWYGQNGLYWCQQFVSWCAYTACKARHAIVNNGWEKVGDRWKYHLYGSPVVSQWLEIGGRWYVFDGAGFMITGWFRSGEKWYYLNPEDGAMLSSQWLTIDGATYYLTASGLMATAAYVKGPGEYYWVGDDGVYRPERDTAYPNLDIFELAN